MVPAHAQAPQTGGQGWYSALLSVRLPSHFRVVAGGELNAGTNYSYQQWTGGAGISYQWKHVSRLSHFINIDSDKESRLVVGAGYEYLWTEQEGAATTAEDRVVLTATPRYRPHTRWLLEDRNRVEWRWVDGDYSTRYRNRLTIERDVRVHDFRFSPYVSAEAFYDFSRGSWDEQQYAVGVAWPYRRIFMVQTYYLFQHCTCTPDDVNVFGVTLNLYVRNGL
ncbi:MAG: hypothetical protein H6Q77_1517 [Gemmatimonadetes bacterium]|nr:hypothetical protein [Gemmatimonadota bacterium]